MPATRAKFKLNSIECMKYGPDQEQRSFKFSPVYSNVDNSENKKFWEASPNGSLVLGVVNPEVWPLFELGEEYYLDFTKAEKK
jgi:hypothetical protein